VASVDAGRPAETLTLERAAYWSMLAFVASLQVSIAAANILLALTALVWLSLLVVHRERPSVPSFFWPLLAYAGWTLVSAFFSVDSETSFIDSKQLVLFAIVPMAYRLLGRERALTTVDVIISVAALSAAIGIVQFGILKWDDLEQRPKGSLGLYMTYSGQLMLVLCLLVARLLFWPRERLWPMLVLPALVVALVVTLSRNAWVGACAGVGLLLLFRDFRLLGFIPVLAALFIAVAPATVTERVTSIFKIADPQQASASVLSNQDRVAMIRSGWRMIQDHPLTGVGPDMIEQVYPVYRDVTAVNQLNPHLHNVPVQIAAERGLPALAIWIVMLIVLLRDFIRQRRTATWVFLSNAGLACVAAMVAAGMFEHNFGDSEFLMLFLLIVTLPYAASRPESSDPPSLELRRASPIDDPRHG
jgi:putative inorganic carbon (hco3(-)) transporter